MSEPVWLTPEIVIAIHEMQLAEHGGPAGIRDMGMLESALGRPQNKFAYGETDLAALAAAYGFGMARNHPFIDGNKRIAWSAMRIFLMMNDVQLHYTIDDAEEFVLAIARGEREVADIAEWIAQHTSP